MLESGLISSILKKSSVALIVRSSGLLVGIMISIYLGRIIGPDGVGTINLVNQIAFITITLSSFGFEKVIVKEVSILNSAGDTSATNNTLFTCIGFTGLLSIALTAALVLLTPIMARSVFNDLTLTGPLLITAFTVLPITITKMLSSALLGYHRIWQSSLFTDVFSTILAGCCLVIYASIGYEISVISVASFYLTGRLISACAIAAYWNHLQPLKSFNPIKIKPLFNRSLPLLITTAIGVLLSSMDIFMLGWLTNASEVGIYSVGARLTVIYMLCLQMIENSASPKIAEFYAFKKLDELKALTAKLTIIAFTISIALFSLFLFLGKPLIGLWGSAFETSYTIMIIIGVGGIIQLSTACSSPLLTMTGHESTVSKLAIIVLFSNFIFNLLLIPRYGSTGAALTTLATVLIGRIIGLVAVYKKTQVIALPSTAYKT